MPIFFCGQIRKVHMEKARGLRKGAWTYEEDNLLKACIHKYGEGKWHLVPKRTGLNRCRKSCRLRWLNYLNPAINRESFAEDEIDMILRLHKLLGNKWSLIAARLPGRTANDVKNYWHTNLRKKVIPRKEENEEKEKSKESMIKSHEVIKPRPRTFSTHSLWLKKKHNFVSNGSATKLVISSEDGNVPRECDKTTLPNLIDSSSSHSPWLKKNHSLPTTLMASREDVNIPRECDKTTLPNVGDAQTCVGNDPSSTTWWESLLNMDEERSNEKIDSSSLLPKENFTLEFSNVEDIFNNGPTVSDSDWDSNLCDFNFFGVFN